MELGALDFKNNQMLMTSPDFPKVSSPSPKNNRQQKLDKKSKSYIRQSKGSFSNAVAQHNKSTIENSGKMRSMKAKSNITSLGASLKPKIG